MPYLIKEHKKSGLSTGYLNQEIAKITFFEHNTAEHYLCVDSDTIFIRDFYKKDFFYDDETPYITLVQDKDLHSKSYYINFAKHRMEAIKAIFDFIGLDDTRYRTCHNSQIFSSKVLASFKNDIVVKKNLTFATLLEISPFEFTWYNAYFQHSKLIKEVSIEPFFKMYHTQAEYALDRLSGNNIENLKTQYIGVILNSNWAKNYRLNKNGNNIINKILYLLIRKC